MPASHGPIGMTRKLGDFWFTVMPVVFLAAFVPLCLINMATSLSITWWLLESRSRHLAGFLVILTYNLSLFYACWRIWHLPLALKTRLQILGWAWFWSPAALPAWRCMLLPALDQPPDAPPGTNPVCFGPALHRFHTFCLKTAVVYLIVLSCALIAVLTFLSQQSAV